MKESGKNRGRLHGQGLRVGGVSEARLPAAEVVDEIVVEHPDTAL